MANTKRSTHLTTGLRCSVYGKPGVVVSRDGTDVTVRLDGETRSDIWQCTQVLLDTCEALCPACDGESQLPTDYTGQPSERHPSHVECEECDGAGVMACTYCGELAGAGRVAYLGSHEWRCEACHDEMMPKKRSSRSRGPGADPDGINSWRGGLWAGSPAPTPRRPGPARCASPTTRPSPPPP